MKPTPSSSAAASGAKAAKRIVTSSACARVHIPKKMILSTGASQCVPVQLLDSTKFKKSCPPSLKGGHFKSHKAAAKGALGGLVCGETFLTQSSLHLTLSNEERKRQKKEIIVSNFCSLNFPSWKAVFTELKLSEWHLWSADAIHSTELSVAKQLQKGPSTLQLHKGHRKREYINLLAWWELNMNISYTFKGCRIFMLVPILFRLQRKWVCFPFTRHKAIKDLKGRKDEKETDLFLVSYSVHLLHKNWWV